MSIKIYCIKSLILKSPKLTSQCAEVFTQNSSAFCICTKHSHQLPPKPPSDFIKSSINVLCIKPRLFLSTTGTAKTCPLRFLPCVPVPATPLPTGRPLAHLCLVPAASSTACKMRLPQQSSRFRSTTDWGCIVQTHPTPLVQEGYIGSSPICKLN